MQLVLARALDARIANNTETLPDRLAHAGPQSFQIPDIGVLGFSGPGLSLDALALLHEYYRVDTERVWAFVADQVPQLIEQLTPLVPSPPEKCTRAAAPVPPVTRT